ncbi:MAG: GNAT family N-acetyltransferase [Paracoccaceae bacterium]
MTDIISLLADDDLGTEREDLRQPLNQGYLSAFEEMTRDPNQMMCVAELDGDIVGCLQITFIPGLSYQGRWRGQIESVRIAKDLRGQGLGRQLIGWAVEQCRARKCGMVQLTAHKSRKDTHRFYASLGFEPMHEGFKLIF